MKIGQIKLEQKAEEDPKEEQKHQDGDQDKAVSEQTECHDVTGNLLEEDPQLIFNSKWSSNSFLAKNKFHEKQYHVKMFKLTLQDKIKKNAFFKILDPYLGESDLSSSQMSKEEEGTNMYLQLQPSQLDFYRAVFRISTTPTYNNDSTPVIL